MAEGSWPKEAGAVEVALAVCKKLELCCGTKSCPERTTKRVVLRFRSSFSALTRSSSWWVMSRHSERTERRAPSCLASN